MNTMETLYNILLYTLNPNWLPSFDENDIVYKIRKARIIEKYLVWPITEFAAGLALLYFFYSLGKKAKQKQDKKKESMSKEVISGVNLPEERPNYNTQNIIDILERKS